MSNINNILREQKRIIDLMNGDIQNRVKSQIRDIKLRIAIGGDLNLSPNLKRLRKGSNRFFNQKVWKSVKKYHSDYVITGSSSLYAFGLIDRRPDDLDLLHDDSIKLPDLCKSRYAGMEHESDMTGYLVYGSVNVDFFPLSPDDNIIEFEGFRFHHPYDILLKKSEIAANRWRSHKDYDDLNFIINRLNEMVS